MPLSMEKKTAYFAKIDELFNTYNRILVVSADNVGSNQMAKIRMSLRGEAVVLMGKNTMMRRALNLFMSSHPGHPLGGLLPHIKGNIGFVFTDKDLSYVRTKLVENVVPAPARVGAEAPNDVFVPPGPTGCDPGQTSFFQALSIGTKIAKGQIEIVTEVHLIHAGDRVEPGQAALLQKLSIFPFSYGLKVSVVYDNGTMFDPVVLDLSDDDIAAKFLKGARVLAAVGLTIGYPTLASLRLSVAGAFAKLLAVSLATGYKTEHTQLYHDYLEDPSKFAAMIGAGAGASGEAAAAAVEEEEEEEEADMGSGGLFGEEGGDDY